jgi:hypothetical protein
MELLLGKQREPVVCRSQVLLVPATLVFTAPSCQK